MAIQSSSGRMLDVTLPFCRKFVYPFLKLIPLILILQCQPICRMVIGISLTLGLSYFPFLLKFFLPLYPFVQDSDKIGQNLFLAVLHSKNVIS